MTDSPRKPDPIDVLIGNRLRMRRMAIGVTQEQLGAMLGLTFQQVQKYEKGTNRISGSRMVQIAQAVRVRPAYFFSKLASLNAEQIAEENDLLSLFGTRESMDLMRAFASIKDKPMKKQIVSLVRALAGETEEVVEMEKAA